MNDWIVIKIEGRLDWYELSDSRERKKDHVCALHLEPTDEIVESEEGHLGQVYRFTGKAVVIDAKAFPKLPPISGKI
jgi:hypothetical protein